jgi:cytochrome P450
VIGSEHEDMSMSSFGGCQPTTNTDLDFGAEVASPAALAVPHPVFHRMRREDPVHHSRALGDWLVTRCDDVPRALRDPRLSSDHIPSNLDAQLGAEVRGRVRDFERTRRATMVNNNRAAHHRLRRLVNPAFTAEVVEAARPMIQGAVDRLLDRAGASTRLGVVADHAGALPTEVLRYDPPLTFVHRVAAADQELGGARIAKGERVLPALAAENRDLEVFPNPDAFDIGRAGARAPVLRVGSPRLRGRWPGPAGSGGRPVDPLPPAPGLALDPESPSQRRFGALMFRGFQTLPVLTSF